MGNTSTKEDVTPSRPLERPVRPGHTKVYSSSATATPASFVSAPTISKSSSGLNSSRPINHSTPSTSSYAPSAPNLPPSPMYARKAIPLPFHEYDPFHLGPSSSRRVKTSTESTGTPATTVAFSRPSSSSPTSTVNGSPVIFWNSDTKSYTTRNPTRGILVSSSVTSSTVRVSDSGSSRMNSTIYPGIDALTTNLDSVSMSAKVTPSVDLASRNSSSSAAPPRTSSNNAAVSSWLQSSPAPSQIYTNGSSARQGLTGAPRDFHKPQSAPAVRVYTPLNSAMPLLSAPDSVQNNNFNGNDSSRGNRGRPFPRGRGRNRGGGNNFNRAGDNSGNQGNNGGRHRGRGQHRGNNRGGFNNNQNQQSDSGSQSVDSARDNGSGEDCQSQNPFEIRNHRAEPTETNSETGDVNPRGRGRFFNRGRGRPNPRRGQGRRNRGGGTENNRPGDNASGASVPQAQVSSGTPTIDLENSPFECPICMEALKSPIYQCHNGHMVCNSCEAQIRQCPICREEMPTKKIRNLPIEQIVTGST